MELITKPTNVLIYYNFLCINCNFNTCGFLYNYDSICAANEEVLFLTACLRFSWLTISHFSLRSFYRLSQVYICPHSLYIVHAYDFDNTAILTLLIPIIVVAFFPCKSTAGFDETGALSLSLCILNCNIKFDNSFIVYMHVLTGGLKVFRNLIVIAH